MEKTTAKRILTVLLFIGMILSALALAGCAVSSDIDTSDMYLVFYHGNGGFLGNKTATVRKLYCAKDSKLPDYPLNGDYSKGNYTVSGLGVATRAGYNLVGWYMSDAVSYVEDEGGHYIYLSTDEGCGVYTQDKDGTYVRKPVEDPEGTVIFVYFEQSASAEEDEENKDKYILIAPQYDEEGNLTFIMENGFGFYICNSPDDYEGIKDTDLKAAYEAAYNGGKGVYSLENAQSMSGYRDLEEFPPTVRDKFDSFEKYSYKYVTAEEGDAELDHYLLASGYASTYDLFIEDDNGLYETAAGEFNKIAAEDKEEDKHYYAVSEDFVFDKDTTVGFKRYNMGVEHWSFTEDRVTEDKCVWDEERQTYVLHLYAHWEKKFTVYYHYNNGTDQVDPMTTRMVGNTQNTEDIRPGGKIDRKGNEPKYAGHTFVGWSTSTAEYLPWDFENDVFPDGVAELHLYAYYLEGEYTRITTKAGLQKIKENLAGKYLLGDNVDFGGEEFEGSPLGLTEGQVFTGEFRAFGNKLSGFTITLKHSNTNQAQTITAALFPKTEGAVIDGLNVEFTVKIANPAKVLDVSGTGLKMACAGLIGDAGEKESTVIGCGVRMTLIDAFAKDAKCEVTVAGIQVKGNVRIENCTAEIPLELRENSKLVIVPLGQEIEPPADSDNGQ